jgi:hypothetical protein
MAKKRRSLNTDFKCEAANLVLKEGRGPRLQAGFFKARGFNLSEPFCQR